MSRIGGVGFEPASKKETSAASRVDMDCVWVSVDNEPNLSDLIVDMRRPFRRKPGTISGSNTSAYLQ
jgi:hypothetical protein